MKEPEVSIKKEIAVQLNKLKINTYSKLKTNYREKKLRKQERLFLLKNAMISGSIRKIK